MLSSRAWAGAGERRRPAAVHVVQTRVGAGGLTLLVAQFGGTVVQLYSFSFATLKID